MSTALDTQQVADLAVWLGEQTWSEFAQNLARYYRRHRTLTEAQLRSAVSMREKANQRQAQRNLANALPKPEIGFYWEPDQNTMWFVRPARNGGNPYAMRKAPLDPRWSYQQGGMVTLANRIHIGSVTPLTLAQAKELGHQFGHCVMCGALLNDPESVANGIGPVCARKLA